MDSDPFDCGRLVGTPERKAIILWDYTTCPVPSGVPVLSAVRNIREVALKFGQIEQFEAYSYWSNNTNISIRNDLSMSGVKLRDCPYHRQKGANHNTFLIDMIVYALERPNTTTIVLISGDRNYAYAISTLRNRGYPVKLLAPAKANQSSLQVLADLLDWGSVFRRDQPRSVRIDPSALARGEEEEEETEEETEEDETEEETEEEETEEEDAGGEEGEEDAEGEEECADPGDREQEQELEVEGGKEESSGSTVKTEQQRQEEVEVETAEVDEDDGAEPGPSVPPHSKSLAMSAPEEIPFTWITAPPELPTVVPFKRPSAQTQQQPETRLLPPLFSSFAPTQPHMFASGSGLENGLPGMGEFLLGRSSRGGVSPKFVHLVEEMKTLKEKGNPNPTWSTLLTGVMARHPSVLSEAGVKKWKNYMLLAEKEGIVINVKGPSGIRTAVLKI